MGRKISVQITPGACIAWALMLLVLPLHWVFGSLFAMAVHELWHLAVILICGGDVFGIRIGAGGVEMETAPQNNWREIVCAAAGPVGSFSLLLLAAYFPAAALCGLIQGVFNLLPVFPMDGGRIARSGLEMLLPKHGSRLSRRVESGCLVLMFLAGVWVVVKAGISMFTLILAAVPLLKLLHQKNTLQRRETRGTIEIH